MLEIRLDFTLFRWIVVQFSLQLTFVNTLANLMTLLLLSHVVNEYRKVHKFITILLDAVPLAKTV